MLEVYPILGDCSYHSALDVRHVACRAKAQPSAAREPTREAIAHTLFPPRAAPLVCFHSLHSEADVWLNPICDQISDVLQCILHSAEGLLQHVAIVTLQPLKWGFETPCNFKVLEHRFSAVLG